MPTPEAQSRRWHASQRITAALPAAWIVVTFGASDEPLGTTEPD